MSADIVIEPYVPQGLNGVPHYCKVRQLGDPYVRDLLTSEVVVEEKVDGSLFRFMKKDGKALCASHNVTFDEYHPVDKNFRGAVEYIESIVDRLPEGVVFFAEWIAKPKQNTIVYSRAPQHGLYLFDAYNTNEVPVSMMNAPYSIDKCSWAGPETLGAFSALFDIDPPIVLFEGMLTRDDLVKLNIHESYLGGSLIEGVVVKNYALQGHDAYHAGNFFMCAKLVRKSFKEENDKNWKGQRDIEGQVIERFKTNARWEKALFHLRDDGKLEGSMRDMRGLIDEVERDIREECRAEIERMLYEHFEKNIIKGVTAGMAEWLKTRLMDNQFTEGQ